MREARKHAAWYMKGIRGAASLRREICELTTKDDIKQIAEKVVSTAEV
jgi:tRNA-dihydrouridine synthase